MIQRPVCSVCDGIGPYPHLHVGTSSLASSALFSHSILFRSLCVFVSFVFVQWTVGTAFCWDKCWYNDHRHKHCQNNGLQGPTASCHWPLETSFWDVGGWQRGHFPWFHRVRLICRSNSCRLRVLLICVWTRQRNEGIWEALLFVPRKSILLITDVRFTDSVTDQAPCYAIDVNVPSSIYISRTFQLTSAWKSISNLH